MLKKIAATLFAVLFIAAFLPAGALADTDNQPPHLISVITDKSSYSSGESVIVTVEATDQSDIVDYVDMNYAFVYIMNKDTSEEQHFFLNTTAQQGELTSSVSVTDHFRTGDYYISAVELVDSCDNYKKYFQDADTAPSFHVENSDRTDFDGPELTSLSVNKTSVSSGDTLTFTATAEDPSGVQTIGVYLSSDSGQCLSDAVYLDPVTGSPNTFQGKMKIDDSMLSDTYTVSCVSTGDNLNNSVYYTNWSDAQHRILPDNMRLSIQVTTSHTVVQVPSLEKVTLSTHSAKPGDPVGFTIEFNTNGTTLSRNYCLMVYFADTTYTHQFALGFYKVQGKDNEYSYSWPVDAYTHPGDYRIYRYDLTYNNNQDVQFWYNADDHLDDFFPVFHISSVYTGVDNVSIPLNTASFDCMAGITASNNTQGDMTKNITYSGSVDTNQVGVYLIKYKIKSNQQDTTGHALYYQEYRWVGVTDAMPDSSSSDLVLTNGSVAIGADSGDVAISKGGSDVGYSAAISGEGDYTVSVKDGGGAVTASKAVLSSEQTNSISGLSAGFIIDRTGPSVSAMWNAASPSDIDVSATCSDPSGVAETKWLPGSLSKSDFKSGGTDFDGSFKVDAFGHYTLYARDKLGNETVQTYDIESSDHTGPEISSTQNIVSLNEIDISAVCTDASGVAVTKWCSGSVSLDTIRDQGTVFDQTFTMRKADSYTIYAKDNFGNESAKTFAVTYDKATGISINSYSAYIAAGYSLQLSAKVSPANATFKDVTWSSGNTAVATVDANGLVQAVSPGTAQITATLADGGKTAVCTVKVIPSVPVKSVHISSTRKSVYIGASFKLSVSVRPSNATVKTIAWSSSDASVVTVDASGRAQAVGIGTATITATANNGKYASCKVTVKPIPVSSVRLNRTKASLTAGASIALTATVRPANATNKTLTWYSTNTAVATVDADGNVLAVAKGTCYIYAKASNGKYARCRVTVS